jgi:hypothetical protein
MTSCRLAGGYRRFGVTAFTFRVLESWGVMLLRNFANHMSDWQSVSWHEGYNIDLPKLDGNCATSAVTFRKSPCFPTVSVRVHFESDNKLLTLTSSKDWWLWVMHWIVVYNLDEHHASRREVQVRSQDTLCALYSRQSISGVSFRIFQLSPISILQPLLRFHLQFHATCIRKTSGGSLWAHWQSNALLVSGPSSSWMNMIKLLRPTLFF